MTVQEAIEFLQSLPDSDDLVVTELTVKVAVEPDDEVEEPELEQ